MTPWWKQTPTTMKQTPSTMAIIMFIDKANKGNVEAAAAVTANDDYE